MAHWLRRANLSLGPPTRALMGPDQVQTLEAQHPISLRNAFQKATFRVVCANIAIACLPFIPPATARSTLSVHII